MRVLHVIETLSPRYGGPVTVLRDLVTAQKMAGLEVEILTTNADYPTGQYCDAGRVVDEASQIPVMFCSIQFWPLRVSFDFARYLGRVGNKFDLIHIHGLYRFPQTFAASWARRHNVPYVIRPHGSLDPYLYNRSSRKVILKRLYEHWFDLPNLQAADAIHYTAEEERQRASFLQLNAPSFIVPNGIEWKRFEQLPSRGQFRDSLDIGDSPLVLFLGRLHHKKGLDLLISAFSLIRQAVPDAHLAIVGSENDDYGQNVRRWVADYGLECWVHFIGHLTSEDVIQAYVDADVFVLPSYTENFGMTVVEAMACGLVVVISDQVNIHAEVAASGAGKVTRCESDEVSREVIALLNDTEARRKMGVNGRHEAKIRYSWPKIVNVLTQEYKTAILHGRNTKH